MNKTKYKSLDKIAADPRVEEIWSEERFEDGIWISLKSGWNWEGCSCVHEWSVKDLKQSFKLIQPGNPN